MVSIYEALKIIENSIKSLKSEIIPIEDAIKRISCENIYAKFDLPRFNNSAMDGYAVKLIDSNKEVKILDTIFAGDNKNLTLKDGFVIKIMTGARVPNECEAIVPQENTITINGNIKLPDNIKNLANMRFSGEDVKSNEIILSVGEKITSTKIALLTSQGVSHIKVYKKPKVVIFATGEELKLHFEKIENHQIYNSNTPSLFARIKELDCEVIFLGTAKDNLKDIKEMIANSLDADLIVTSGGISVGDADFTKEAFDSFGFEIFFNKIDIKPGKPTLFGKIGKSYILNLPGNPFASAINFEIFGRAIIYKLSGFKDYHHSFILAKISKDLKIKSGKNTVISGYFDGEYFKISQKRSPGMVSALNDANSFIVTKKDTEFIPKDKIVKIIPISWNFTSEEFKEFI